MSTISALPSSIVNWLNIQESLSNIKFLTEYPPQYKAVPLKKPIVAVGINNVTISDHFTENSEGVLEKDEYCRSADIEIKLSIHVPFSDGGNMCHEVFTSVVDCLTFSSDLNITQSACESISSDRDTEALVMNAKINIQSDFCPAEEVDNSFHSFLDKELLCGSHIRNDEIHITQEERETWNGRTVKGHYFGDGKSTQTINLGFKPAFLAVFPFGDFPVFLDSDSNLEVSFAFMAGSEKSYGLDPIENGFRVLNGTAHSYNKNIPYLNKSGVVYSYFAIKPIYY
ncbi:MAG: hypothetical protein IIX39_07285 [Clostridia bacterium]|nr:hypothetical protein [Clostridia bacterium]